VCVTASRPVAATAPRRAEADAAQGTAPRRDLLPDPSTGRSWSPKLSTRSFPEASEAWPSASCTTRWTSSRTSRRRAHRHAEAGHGEHEAPTRSQVPPGRSATYQVPVEVRPRRATTLSIRWLVGYSRQRREKTMAQRLANELLDASNGVGAAVKRRKTCTRWPNPTRRSLTTAGSCRLTTTT